MSLKINDTVIELVDKTKYLGMYIDKDLSFNAHVDHIAAKLNQRFFLIKRLNNMIKNKKMVTLVFEAYVQSIILYGSNAFISCLTEGLKRKVFRVFKQSEKMKLKSRNEVMSTLEKKRMAFLKKIVENCHHPLNNKIKFLRSGRRLAAIFCRTVLYQRTFVPNAINCFNSLL